MAENEKLSYTPNKSTENIKIMEQTDQNIEPTWGMALKIWWWIGWRSLLTAILGAIILGFIVGIVLGLAGMNSAAIQIIGGLLGGVLGIGVNVYFTKKIIGKKFKNFSVVLLRDE